MTTVRIVFARHHLRAAPAPDGSNVPDWRLHQQLIVLADTVPTEMGATERFRCGWFPATRSC